MDPGVQALWNASLTVCGVTTVRGRNLITQDFPEGFIQFISVTKEILSNMKKEYMTLYAAANRYKMSRACEANLYAMCLWLKDKHRLGLNLDNESPTLDLLNDSVEYEQLRLRFIADAPTAATTNNPGPFKDESHWIVWIAKMKSYLGSQPGATGISLAYIIREQEVPPPGARYATFHECCIAEAPLTGNIFQADNRKVHEIILSFIAGYPAEQHMLRAYRPNERRSGRKTFQALWTYYNGTGHSSRRLNEADAIHNNLFYIRETQQFPFTKFSAQLTKMFNIYALEGQVKSENEKLRTLFRMIRCDTLKSAVASLKSQMDLHGTVTLDSALSHLQTCVSDTAITTPRNNRRGRISQLKRGRGGNNDRGGGGKRRRTDDPPNFQYRRLPAHIWKNMKESERRKHFKKEKERAEAMKNESADNTATVSAANTVNREDMEEIITRAVAAASIAPQQPAPAPIPPQVQFQNPPAAQNPNPFFRTPSFSSHSTMGGRIEAAAVRRGTTMQLPPSQHNP